MEYFSKEVRPAKEEAEPFKVEKKQNDEPARKGMNSNDFQVNSVISNSGSRERPIQRANAASRSSLYSDYGGSPGKAGDRFKQHMNIRELKEKLLGQQTN